MRTASFLLSLIFAVWLSGCSFRPTRHATVPAALGTPTSTEAVEAVLDTPGPIRVETVAAADWGVDRSGLINLDHAEARKRGLEDGVEPIQVYFHVLRHPEHGVYLIDTGVERALVTAPRQAAIRGMVAMVMHLERMSVRRDTASWLASTGERPAGVLLTHLHMDHVSGLPDIPRGTPIYVGPGETRERRFVNLFVRSPLDRALAGHAPLRELGFAADPSGRFAGVLDLFGDQSVFAFWVPGHTAGSLAYLARTPDGPVLFAGDASHTRFGWEHGVEPGSFSADGPKSAESLARLRAFAAKHPALVVKLGHQPLSQPSTRQLAKR